MFLDLRSLPTPERDQPKRAAVALDCEMVEIEGGHLELARLTAVDCLSGETLVDRLVQPQARITNWLTRHSGITYPLFRTAKAAGQLAKNFQQAREELFRYVDDDTILVGLALNNDLDVLRIQHDRVVDLTLLLREQSTPRTIGLGLQKLTKAVLGKDIQNRGKQGHDSLEDALATRELLLWCLERPQEMRKWGYRKRLEDRTAQHDKRVDAVIRSVTKKLESLVGFEDTFTFPWSEGMPPPVYYDSYSETQTAGWEVGW